MVPDHRNKGEYKMARDTLHTKCRLCRREGVKLYLKGARCLSSKCPIEKKGAVPPGMHGLKRASRQSSYGIQLRAKQKVKRFYGVLERQMKRYYLQAKDMEGLLGHNLLIQLEIRLDNVVCIAGLAKSRSAAKQLISHRKVIVNGKILNVSSYQIKVNDVVSLKPVKKMADMDINATDKDFKAPPWMELDKAQYSVKIINMPKRQDIPQDFEENLIIEYYSR